MTDRPIRLPNDMRSWPIAAPAPGFGRRGLLAGAAGSAAMLAAQVPVLAQPAPPPGSAAQGAGQTAVIDVDRARAAPIPIAIPDLAGPDGASAQLGADIAGVIRNDLANSGLFRAIDQAAFIGQAGTASAPASEVPNFQNWQVIGAQALVTGKVEIQGDGNIRVEFRLWDVLPQSQLQGTAYTTTRANWRRIVAYRRRRDLRAAAGREGLFRFPHRLCRRHRSARPAHQASGDHGPGQREQPVPDRWPLAGADAALPSDASDEIAFMSYANNRPRVYLFDLTSGRQQRAGRFRGMTLSPRFSPDGSSVIMSVTDGGGSDIVAVDLASRGGAPADQHGRDRRLARATARTARRSPSTRTAAATSSSMSWMPTAANVRRISYGKGRYATPVWSPRGDLIAFTKLGGDTDNFSIGVMHPDGSGERMLSDSLGCGGTDLLPERPGDHVLARDAGRARGAASARAWCRSTSPGSTSAW